MINIKECDMGNYINQLNDKQKAALEQSVDAFWELLNLEEKLVIKSYIYKNHVGFTGDDNLNKREIISNALTKQAYDIRKRAAFYCEAHKDKHIVYGLLKEAEIMENEALKYVDILKVGDKHGTEDICTKR